MKKTIAQKAGGAGRFAGMAATLMLFVVVFLFSFSVAPASAHEVYVLDSSEITTAMQMPELPMMNAIEDNALQFWEYAIGGIIFLILWWFITTRKFIARAVGGFFAKLRPWAARILQVTLGIAIVASGWHQALFGTELPFNPIFGHLSQSVSYLLMLVGAMLILGIFPRIAGAITLVVFVCGALHNGWYITNYATYAGEAIALILFGGAYTLFTSNHFSLLFTKKMGEHLHQYKFLIMRVFFGVSVIYASVYAKYLHAGLALETVSKYSLTHFFPFEPTFLVLGAMLVEISIGLCIVIGFETRFFSGLFLAFLTASLFFFGESVWPHFILIGTALAILIYGYDRYSLSWYLGKRTNSAYINN